MILSFLLLCLSISLKIVALTARVGLNAAVATADVASKAAIEGTAKATGSENSDTTQMVRIARQATLGAIKFAARAVDALLSLVMVGWVTVLAIFAIFALILAGGGWFWLTNLSDKVSPEALSIGNSNGGTTVSAAAAVNAYDGGNGVPTVAASPSQIGPAILANAKYAMANLPAQGYYSYDWGGRGPSGYDCSGWVSALLLMSGWTMDDSGNPVQLGADQDRIVVGQSSSAQVTSLLSANSAFFAAHATPYNGDESVLTPGDIITGPGHVAIYVGDGWIVHASDYGATGLNVSPDESSAATHDVGFQKGYLNQWVTGYVHFG